jgi:hypothetical protein
VNVALRVEASVSELRRLLGLPDVLAVYEVRSRAFERWLAAHLAATENETEARRGQDGAGEATSGTKP